MERREPPIANRAPAQNAPVHEYGGANSPYEQYDRQVAVQ